MFSLLFFDASCSAKTGTEEKDFSPMQRREMMLREAVGDSISNIMLRSRHVEIYTDSCAAVRLKADERAVVRYLMADSCNLSGYTKVYGEFEPYLYIRFQHCGKVVTAQYDFRLQKWMMKGTEGELLCMYDLRSSDILQFASLALPKDKYLNLFIKEQAK